MKKVLAKKHTAWIACSAIMAAALTGGLAGLTSVNASADEGDASTPKVFYYVDAGHLATELGGKTSTAGRESEGFGGPIRNQFMIDNGLEFGTGTDGESGKVYQSGLYNSYTDWTFYKEQKTTGASGSRDKLDKTQVNPDPNTGKYWGADWTDNVEYAWCYYRYGKTTSTTPGYDYSRYINENNADKNDLDGLTYKFEVDDDSPLRVYIGTRKVEGPQGGGDPGLGAGENGNVVINGGDKLSIPTIANTDSQYGFTKINETTEIKGVQESDGKYYVTLNFGGDGELTFFSWILIAEADYSLVTYTLPTFVKSDATTVTATPSDGTADVTATLTDESKAAIAAAQPLTQVEITATLDNGDSVTNTVTVIPATTQYFLNIGSDHHIDGTDDEQAYSSGRYGWVSEDGTQGWRGNDYYVSNRWDVSDITYRFDLPAGSYGAIVGATKEWGNDRTATITANNGPAKSLVTPANNDGHSNATCYGDVVGENGHLDVNFKCQAKGIITYILVFGHTHGTMTSHDAVTATCEHGGNDAYYQCSVCEQKYGNEAGTTAYVTHAQLSHSGTKTDAVVATCEAPGRVAYWTCANGCGKKYNDNNGVIGETVLEESDMAVAQLSHSGTHHEAVAESCTTPGNIEYWECTNGCGKNYSDANYTTELTTDPTIAAHHTFTEVTWGAWTEKAEGGWTCTYSAACTNCDATENETEATITPAVTTPATCVAPGVRTYTAKAGNVTNPTTKTEEIAMIAHNGIHNEAAEPTCTEPGNIEYWSCDKGCEKNYSNADCTTELTTDPAIAAIGHDYDYENIVWTWDGTTAATAKVTCKTDDTHIDEITATITSAVTKQATETEEGETTYTATITVGDETYTTTKTASIAKLTSSTAGGDEEEGKSGGCGSSIGGTVGMVAGLSVCLGAACAAIFLRKKKIQK